MACHARVLFPRRGQFPVSVAQAPASPKAPFAKAKILSALRRPVTQPTAVPAQQPGYESLTPSHSLGADKETDKLSLKPEVVKPSLKLVHFLIKAKVLSGTTWQKTDQLTDLSMIYANKFR